MSALRTAIAPIALCLTAFACARRADAPPAPSTVALRPAGARNVVLILLDTLRSDHLSSYGYPRPTSPNLDAFGRENARFDQVRSQAACTFPSMNSLLTSRSGFSFLGQPNSRIGIPESFPALAELLRAEGMQTIAISASPIVRRNRSKGNHHGGFDRGFDIFDESCYQRHGDCIGRRAHRYLNKNLNHGVDEAQKPFLLYLHYMDAHSLYNAPAPYSQRFTAAYDGPDWVKDGNPRPLYDSLAGRGPKVVASPRDLQHMIDLYDGEIAYMDAQLGELLDDLQSRGLFETSLIVIAADHGEEFLEHGHVMHCDNVFETTIRVPLFVHVPGLPNQSPTQPAIADLVENIDILPTVLDYLRIAAPAGIEGRSLRPLLEGKAATARPAFTLQNQLRAVTDGKAKLVLDLATGESALYDLAVDPGETTNVMTSSRPTFHDLHDQLAAWLQRVEGSPTAEHSLEISEESRKRLEALGYLR